MNVINSYAGVLVIWYPANGYGDFIPVTKSFDSGEMLPLIDQDMISPVIYHRGVQYLGGYLFTVTPPVIRMIAIIVMSPLS